MPSVRYLVPYEAAFHGRDIGSGKPLSNVFYLRSGTASGAAPAYGTSIPGSDQLTFATNLSALFNAQILPIMNANYVRVDLTMRAILGKQYKTPFEPILVLTPGAPINITTTLPHMLTTGDQVFLQGVTSPPTANGAWTVTVGSATDFTLNGSNSALLWSGDGSWQSAIGALQFTYADKLVLTSTSPGTVVGDALPLFATASVRRLNTGVGRSFRSRVSMSPMSESDSLDGGFLPARVTAINAAFTAFGIGVLNAGTDAGMGTSYQIAVSKKLASMQPPIFTSYFSWTALVGSWICQRNCGTLTRRKPKLTATIV